MGIMYALGQRYKVTKLMVIFSSKLKETGAKIFAMATTLCISPCVILKAQFWCQVSVSLTHSFQRYSSFSDLSQCDQFLICTIQKLK